MGLESHSFSVPGVKVEWAKSHARAARYQEEIRIVKEEMNRTIRFLTWKADQWRRRGVAKQAKGVVQKAYADGLQAYAARQAAICEGQIARFQKIWLPVDAMIQTASLECGSPERFYERRRRELQVQKAVTGEELSPSSALPSDMIIDPDS